MPENSVSDIDAIRLVARRFRDAIELGGLERSEFSKFPSGACGVASELLGEFLRDNGYGDWCYVRGMDHAPDSSRSHGWLYRNGIRIDITGDQFGQDPVVVTTEPIWVGEFEGSLSHVAGLDYYDSTLVAFRSDYATIYERMTMAD